MTDPKSTLRATLRRARREVSADAARRAARSASLWQQVVDLIIERRPDATTAALRIMLFESLPAEPDTSAWLADAAARGWSVYVPEVDGSALRVVPGDVDTRTLDVVVVPGVGYTPTGERLGQGGGHYDRFLRRVRGDCLTIGVCYREQLVDAVPLEPHDVTVDVVVAA